MALALFLAVTNQHSKYTTDPLWLLIWLLCGIAATAIGFAVVGVWRRARGAASGADKPNGP